MKKILLADDHTIVRLGIKALINENLPLYNIDEAGTEEQVIHCIKNNKYDLVLLDIQIPDTDFGKLMQWINVIAPDTNILVFTMHTEEMYGLRCLQMGAKGFLRKTASNHEILAAIIKVLNNEKYINPRLSELLLESYNKPNKPENPFDTLSQREMEIVKHLDNSKTLTEVCEILKIQYSTANTYKRRIFEKLNVKSVLELSRLMHSFDK